MITNERWINGFGRPRKMKRNPSGFAMVVGITLGVLFIVAANVGALLATYLIGRYLANYFGF